MEYIKKNVSLVLGMAIPVLMIIFVAGSIYLPGLFIQPRFNFLYATGGDNYYYNGGQQYVVQNGVLVQNEKKNQPPTGTITESRLFLYDVTRDESREISFDEARGMNLNSNLVSPDDFEVVPGGRGGGIFPFDFNSGVDYNARYVQGHNVSKKINWVRSSGTYYYNDFHFLGWIKQ